MAKLVWNELTAQDMSEHVMSGWLVPHVVYEYVLYAFPFAHEKPLLP